METCTCGHSRYDHAHADEKEVANPDAWLRGRCLTCDCEQFDEVEISNLSAIAKAAATYVVLRERGRGGEKAAYDELRSIVTDSKREHG